VYLFMNEVRLSVAEIADKYTILKIKQNHGLDVYSEMWSLQGVLEESGVDCAELERINSIMWEIEDLGTKGSDLRVLGVYFLALRYMTLVRTNEKNRIARKYGDPEEQKNYFKVVENEESST
jgi:hypothetical protein